MMFQKEKTIKDKNSFRIGIDARMYSIPGGIGRYTQELINNLEKIDSLNQYVIFIDKEGFKNYKPQNKNFQKVLVDVGWYGFAEQIKMPRIWEKMGVDLMHFTHFNKSIFYRKPYVVTIHDLTYSSSAREGMKISKLPPIVYKIKYIVYGFAIRDTIKKAKKIIVPSLYSKNDIIKTYKLNLNRIAVTYESVSGDFSPDKKEKIFNEVKNKFGINKKYFFYVGNASPHKNIKRLILAFNLLAKEYKDIQLVLAGKKEKFYLVLEDFVQKEKLGDGRIIFTDKISDKELQALLANSYAFVFPSLAEGFGIPPLEAMASGTAVLASEASCLPEICCDAVYYFDPYDEKDIAKKMGLILKNKNLRKYLVERGLNHIKKFSWKKMAKETRDIYIKALGE